MNYHYINMVIKKLVETTLNSLNLLGVGELTPFELSTLMPVSGSEGALKMLEFRV